MEPKPRFETIDAIKSLANDLKLPYAPNMQDWAYEVADTNSIEQYIEHYHSLNDDDQKFVLMMIIIQALEEEGDIARRERYWDIISNLIIENFHIHEYTLYYWCAFGNDNMDENFWMCPYCRKLWAQIKSQ